MLQIILPIFHINCSQLSVGYVLQSNFLALINLREAPAQRLSTSSTTLNSVIRYLFYLCHILLYHPPLDFYYCQTLNQMVHSQQDLLVDLHTAKHCIITICNISIQLLPQQTTVINIIHTLPVLYRKRWQKLALDRGS